MFGNILLRLGTYLVETFVGKSTVRDGGIRLEHVNNAIETKIEKVRTSSDLAVTDALEAIRGDDDKSSRGAKVDAVAKLIENSRAQVTPTGSERDRESILGVLARGISEVGFYKVALGCVLLILLISPSIINRSINESGLKSGAKYLVTNFQSFELNGYIKAITKTSTNITQATAKLEELEKNLESSLKEKPDGSKVRSDLGDILSLLSVTGRDLKIRNTATQEQPAGWIYIGEASADQKTWIKVKSVSNSVRIEDLKDKTEIVITEGTYIRTPHACPHSAGDVIGATAKDNRAVVVGDIELCPLTPEKKSYGVWANVRIINQ